MKRTIIIIILIILIISLFNIGYCGQRENMNSNGNTWITDVELTPYDSDSDGYNNSVTAYIEFYTNNIGYTKVKITGYLFDPNNDNVDIDSESISISASGGDYGETYLDLNAPLNSPKGEYTVNITLTVEENRYDSFMDEVNLYPLDYIPPTLEILCEDNLHYVDIGVSTKYFITVKNNGDNNVQITLDIQNRPNDWDASLDNYSKNLNANSSDILTLIVKSPNTKNSTRVAKLTIEVASLSSELKDSSIITTIIGFADFSLSSEDIAFSNENPELGDSINISVKIKNEGTISASQVEMQFLNDTIKLDSQTIKNIEKEGGQAIFILNWKITEGTHTIWVEIDYENKIEEFNENNNRANKTITLAITYDITILGYNEKNDEFSDSITKSTSPGLLNSFIFEVIKKGNAETITLEILGLDQEENGWSGYFSDVSNTKSYTTNIQLIDFTEIIDMTGQPPDIAYLNNNTEIDRLKLKLGAEQKVYVKIKIIVPFDLSEGDQKIIKLKGISEEPELEDPIDNEVEITINVLLPDIVIEKMDYPEVMREGEIVTISAYIKNIGDIEAKDIKVSLYVDNSEVKNTQINRIPKGYDTLLINFNWQAISGVHNLKIVVDPENTVAEKNDQFKAINNNIISTNVNVKSTTTQKDKDTPSNKTSDENGFFYYIIIVVTVIIIIVIIIIVVLKKESGKVPPQLPTSYPPPPPPPPYY